jgi:hypothetical protein
LFFTMLSLLDAIQKAVTLLSYPLLGRTSVEKVGITAGILLASYLITTVSHHRLSALTTGVCTLIRIFLESLWSIIRSTISNSWALFFKVLWLDRRSLW